MLLKPLHTEPCVGGDVAFKLRELLIEDLIDKRESRSHPHRSAVWLVDASVSREDRHARADGCLPQVDWGDLTLLELSKRIWELFPKFVDESTPVDESGIDRARATGQNDGGCERIHIVSHRSICQLCPNGPRSSNCPS